ncbi:MAG TPA: ImmA/IrrE family metallo-endopeptidase [Woeseiaceae bacterium]|nr:ImmA/IrrE family metallo-endopeptidase [Woeseiaceae bacterium]
MPVESIANHLGLTVEYTDLGRGVSGLLVASATGGTIGVNRRHHRVRQRFSIAHEIGHFKLHADAAENLFIDKEYVLFRDDRASRGEIRHEIQANMFAASLLMPAPLLRLSIEEGHVDLGDDHQVNELANEFQVSLAAMAYRIMRLFR